VNDFAGIKGAIDAYVRKFSNEKESLVAKFLAEKKCPLDEVCLVETEDQGTRVFFPAIKSDVLSWEQAVRERDDYLKALKDIRDFGATLDGIVAFSMKDVAREVLEKHGRQA
jgi:hypothetical protein